MSSEEKANPVQVGICIPYNARSSSTTPSSAATARRARWCRRSGCCGRPLPAGRAPWAAIPTATAAPEPDRNTVVEHGELITADFPPLAFATRSRFHKVRDRASFAFGLVSVATELDVADGVVCDARLALGGVAHTRWRATRAEEALRERTRPSGASATPPRRSLPARGRCQATASRFRPRTGPSCARCLTSWRRRDERHHPRHRREFLIRNETDIDPESGLPFSSRHLVACLREGARRF